jgi:hypothetical protein
VNATQLLERHLARCTANAQGWIDPVLRAAAANLLKPGHPAIQGIQRGDVARAVELLQARCSAFSDAFESELGRQLQADVAPRRTIQSDAGLGGELKLLDEEQAVEEVEVLRTIQLVEGGAEWELRELQALTATLRGQTAVGARSNPLRPEVVARSFWAAAASLGVDGPVRRVLLRAAGEPLTPAMQQACRDAIGWLTEWGVRPAAWKVSSVASGRLPGPPPSGFDLTRPGAFDELRSVASGANARSRVHPTGSTASPDAARLTQALLAALDKLPQPTRDAASLPWLRQRQRQWAEPTRDTVQGDTIELLAELFERMLGDERTSQAVLARISRLQPTLLRVALTDRSLLSDHAHPAWCLVNRIASHTLGYDSTADPRLVAFLERLDPWLDAVTVPLTPGNLHLQEAASALEGLCLAHLRQEQQSLGSSIERLRRAEREVAHAQSVREQVRADLAPPTASAALSPALRELFVGAWCDAVGRVAARDGESSAAVRRLAALPRDIAASLVPMPNRAMRAQLLKQLPALASTFQEGLALTVLGPERRQALADELLTRHSAALAPAGRAADPSPEDIVRSLRDEVRAPPDEAARYRPNTVIDESQLDTLPAALADTASAAVPPRWLEGAQAGLWCHLFIDGGWRAARLVWVGEARGHWLFSSDQSHAHLLTARAIARLALDGLLHPLQERNLLERAVDGWLADGSRARG